MSFLVAGAALEVGGHLERGGLVDGLEVLLLDGPVQVASEVPPVRPEFRQYSNYILNVRH